MQSSEVIPMVSSPGLEQLASALRALPQVAPEQSSWAEIASRLESAPGREALLHTAAPKRWLALAAAASLAVAFGWLGFAQWNRLAEPALESIAAVAVDAEIKPRSEPTQSTAQAALIERSGSMERWLVDSGSAEWPQDFGSASASVEIENLIASVDQRLTRSDSNAERDQLWQRRVGLLEQLVSLQGQPLALSLPDTSAAMVL